MKKSNHFVNRLFEMPDIGNVVDLLQFLHVNQDQGSYKVSGLRQPYRFTFEPYVVNDALNNHLLLAEINECEIFFLSDDVTFGTFSQASVEHLRLLPMVIRFTNWMSVMSKGSSRSSI
jgi:hypothetical protein